MISCRKRNLCCLAVVAVSWSLIGDAAEDNLVQTAGSEAETARWIRQLDSDTSAERQEASVKLGKFGAAAFAALVQAAMGDSPEVTERAIALLQRQLEAAPDETMR